MRPLAPFLLVALAAAAPAGAVAPPVATSGAATPGNGSVTFAGTVNPRGEATTFFFQYGPTVSYGSSTLRSSAGAAVGVSAAGASAAAAFLPGETYHYRIVAQSKGGTARGADATVTMPPPGLPDVSAATVTGIGTSSAVLSATVDAGGGRGTCWFEIGTTSAYGSSTAPIAFRAGAAHAVRWTTVASGLAPSTTYHFRLATTTTDGGTTEGPDETLTTKAAAVRPLKGAGPLRLLPPGMRGPVS